MSVSCVEPEDANQATRSLYEDTVDRFDLLLNVVKVFGHAPELGKVLTASVVAILQDAELDLATKELIILKTAHRSNCSYCVAHHEVVSQRMGIPAETIADLADEKYKDSKFFSKGEKALLDLTVQIEADANGISQALWDRLHAHYTEPQVVEAVFVITQFIAISKLGDALGVTLEPEFASESSILDLRDRTTEPGLN